MPFYVRLIKGDEWDSVSSTTGEDTSFPATVLTDVLDTQGETSVWAIPALQTDNRKPNLEGREMARIVAALHLPPVDNLSEMTFRIISDFRLDRLGLKKRQSGGTSLIDTGLNASGTHWIIMTPTVREGILLAKGLTHVEPITFSRAQVMRCFSVSLAQNWISPEKVRSEVVATLNERRPFGISG